MDIACFLFFFFFFCFSFDAIMFGRFFWAYKKVI